MTNHPNRSNNAFRFIAFSTIDQSQACHSANATDALDRATRYLSDGAFVEVLDCGENGRKVWEKCLPLHQVRPQHVTVYRGAGYDDESSQLPAVALVS